MSDVSDLINRASAAAATTRNDWVEMTDCPFCAARADEYATSISYLHNPSTMTVQYVGECGECGALGPPRDTPEGALEAWGRVSA